MTTTRRWFGAHPARLLLAWVMLLAVTVGVGPAPPEVDAAPAQPATTYTNPVLGGQTVNPHVMRAADGMYYAYVNGFDLGGSPWLVPVFRSSDLASWTALGSVLTSPGAWADAASGLNVTSPSALHVPTNPAAQRYVLYYSAKRAGSSERCIGVATASTPTGPFAAAAQPLICPPGGAQDPSPLPSAASPQYQQVVYRKNGTGAGIYNQLLTANALSINPNGTTPFPLQTAQPTWWHQGVVERPALVMNDDVPYLLFSAGPANTAARAIGWSRCRQVWGIVNGCPNPTHLGSLIESTSQVQSPSGPQVFSDGTHRWLAYDGLPAGSCPTTGPCSGTRSGRIDKLCFRNDHPRTTAPSAGAQPLARSADCSADVPGAALSVTSVTDNGTTVPRPPSIGHRDGGETGVVDGRLVRAYADTLVPGGAPPIVSNTGSVGAPHPSASGPYWATEPVDGSGFPPLLIPFTAAEVQYNQQHWCPPSQGGSCDNTRIALWPAGPVPTGDTNTIFFLKLVHDIGCGELCYEDLQVGAVRVDVVGGQVMIDRSATASPVGCNPTCLFDNADVEDASAFTAPLVAGGHVYLYGRNADLGDTPLGGLEVLGAQVARAPVGQIDDPAAWSFWAGGSSWSPEPSDAVDIPDKWSFATVEYVPYLDRYVSVGEHLFTQPNRFYMQTAPSPTGPWTPINTGSPLINAVACPGAGNTAYAVNLHAPLHMAGGRQMALSYARPGPNWGMDPSCPGQERFVTVRLG